MNANDQVAGAGQTERRRVERPPTGPRYRRLRREVDVPDTMKEVGYTAMKPLMLLLLLPAFALIWYFLT